jgi:polysaccharide biosynthesis transport protein
MFPALQNPTSSSDISFNPETNRNEGDFRLTEIWKVIRRRQRVVLVAGSSIFIAITAYTLYLRITAPVYSGSFQLLITDPINSEAGSSSGNGGVVEALARNRTSTVDFPTLIQTLTSPLVLDPLRRQLGAGSAPLDKLKVRQAVSDSQAGNLGVLEVSLKGSKPVEVQRSLDVLSKAYLQFALSQRRERINQGMAFLDKQEPVLTAKVNLLQLRLATFRRQHNLLSPEAEAGSLKGESMGMATQLREVEADRIRLFKMRQEIASGRLTAANFSGDSSQADGVVVTQARSDLLGQLESVQEQLTEARSAYRSDSPRVLNLIALRNRLAAQRRSQQLEALDTALALNANRSATLNAQIQQIDRRFLKQPNLIKDFEERMKQLNVAQENLTSLLTTRATFQLEEAQSTLPWKLISPPRVQGFPEEPSLREGVISGLLLGALAGVGAGMLRDKLDHGFRSPSEVKESLSEPLLGHIPYVSFFRGVREEKRYMLNELDRNGARNASVQSDTQQQTAKSATSGALNDNSVHHGITGYQRFYYQEAFRNLFTSIRFLSSDKPLRTLALTSSLPAEGKTMVNSLLAKTLSDMGQRVLLVDADMRKPQLQFRLGLNNITGLSNLLTEANLHWRDALQQVHGYDNWSVITAGTLPPDSPRLLSSNRMHELVQELAESDQFDLVIFDTPPVLGLADAPLVAQHVDGIILLVSIGAVDRDLPKEAISRIRSSGAQFLGVVTNSTNEESEQNLSYGYGNKSSYGNTRYGYGYGYGTYDPRSSYSYYAISDDESPADTNKAGQAEPSTPLRVQASNALRHFLKWIDK